jgi:hypothetical protein
MTDEEYELLTDRDKREVIDELSAENKRLREKYRIQTEARATAEILLRECQKLAQLPPTDEGYALKARVEELIGASQADGGGELSPATGSASETGAEHGA